MHTCVHVHIYVSMCRYVCMCVNAKDNLECCGLNISHRLKYLNGVVGTVWVGLGDMVSLEEMCHWGGL